MYGKLPMTNSRVPSTPRSADHGGVRAGDSPPDRSVPARRAPLRQGLSWPMYFAISSRSRSARPVLSAAASFFSPFRFQAGVIDELSRLGFAQPFLDGGDRHSLSSTYCRTASAASAARLRSVALRACPGAFSLLHRV